MGVIYSSLEVARATLPMDGAHQNAAEMVMDKVSSLDGSALTVVHGSVPDNRANIRSDLDVLIAYRFDRPVDEPVVVDGIKAVLDDIAAETNVKIEPNIWPADEPLVARVERMYDTLFAHHLARAMSHPKWSVGEVDEKIAEVAATPLDGSALMKVMFNYLTYKHSGVAKAPRIFNESDRSALLAFQRVLELPKALGRKILQLTHSLTPDAASDYCGAFEDNNVGDELRNAMAGLRAIDTEYTALVAQLANAQQTLDYRDIGDYADWLSDRYNQALPLGMIAASGFTRYLAKM